MTAFTYFDQKKFRRRAAGSNMAIFCVFGALLVGFLGLCIYGGMQNFVETELQEAAMSSAMAGAAALYGDSGASGRPTQNAGKAQTTATSTFNTFSANTSLKGFTPTLDSVNVNAGMDIVTVNATAKMSMALLSAVGINTFQTKAKASAMALRYEPSAYGAAISILPVAGDVASYSKEVKLDFPLVDGPGSELYVEQDSTLQQPYIVEACGSASCYSLVEGAEPVGTSQIVTLPDGNKAIIGTAMIDIKKANVNKGAKLRFVHGNTFEIYNAGALQPPPTAPTPLVIRRVILFGYAGACASDTSCSVPAGFAPAGK